MIDARELGDRFRKMRRRFGFSQETVAGKLGLSRTALTNIENGSRKVSVSELAKLAEIYCCSPSFFLEKNGKDQEENIAIVLQRALPDQARSLENGYSVRRMVDLYSEGARLRKILNKEFYARIPDYAVEMKSAGDAVRQGERVAAEERRRLDLGNAPISDMPCLLIDQGIWTADTEGLPESMSGLFIHHKSTGLGILVNANHGRARKRFSYAHEYAHALFDREQSVIATRSENSSELAEKRANAFASAFLMPRGGVEQWLNRIDKGRPSRLAQTTLNAADGSVAETEIRPRPGSQSITCHDVVVLAHRFGVSYEAAVWRLKNLNQINSSETDFLHNQKETAKKYFKFQEGEETELSDQAFHDSLVRLAVEAFIQERISQGRFLEIGKKLELKAEELLEMAEITRGG